MLWLLRGVKNISLKRILGPLRLNKARKEHSLKNLRMKS